MNRLASHESMSARSSLTISSATPGQADELALRRGRHLRGSDVGQAPRASLVANPSEGQEREGRRYAAFVFGRLTRSTNASTDTFAVPSPLRGMTRATAAGNFG